MSAAPLRPQAAEEAARTTQRIASGKLDEDEAEAKAEASTSFAAKWRPAGHDHGYLGKSISLAQRTSIGAPCARAVMLEVRTSNLVWCSWSSGIQV